MHDCHFWPVMFIPRFPLRFPCAAVLALALPGFAPAQTPPHVAPAPRPAPAAPVAPLAPVAPTAVSAVNTEPAPTAASTEPAAAAQPVSLHALVISALEANLEIQSKRLDPLIQDSHVLTAWGAFDPVVSLSASSVKIQPASLKVGKGGWLLVTLSNSGNVASSGQATIALGLAIGQQEVIALSSPATRPLVVAADHRKMLRLHFVIPTGSTPGSYVPYVSITEDGSTASAFGTMPVELRV